MTIIEVMVTVTDTDGTEQTYWGGETGTPEFYTVIGHIRGIFG